MVRRESRRNEESEHRRAPRMTVPRSMRSKGSVSENEPIYDLLRRDHERFQEMLSQIVEFDLDDLREARDIFKELTVELKAHTEAEQKSFYDALKKFDETERDIMEAEEEHHIVDVVMEEAMSTRNAERFFAKAQVLCELVRHHIREEEDKVFQKAQDLFDDEDEVKIGAKFERLKEKLLKTH